MYIKWWPPPRKSPPDYEVEHHVIKIWTKCQKCLKITPNLHNAWTALFVNPLVEKGDEWNFWSRKKLHLERPPTHPFLLLLCCRVKPCTTPLLFHIVSSQCFHIDTRYGQWEKYTSANCKWRTLFFYFTEIVKNFAHWAMYCCTFVPLLLPPLWHLTLKGAVLHWRKQKLLRHPCWYKILPNCHCQHWSWWNSIVTLLSSLEQGVGAWNRSGFQHRMISAHGNSKTLWFESLNIYILTIGQIFQPQYIGLNIAGS